MKTIARSTHAATIFLVTILIIATQASLSAVAQTPDVPAAHGDCAQLISLKLPDVQIAESIAVAAGTGAIKMGHCRVAGVIGKEIHFSLLLPDEWNHKFMMGGSGGFVGSVDNQAVSSVNMGYATVGTDTGHKGVATDAKWALNSMERLKNFGYLAVHRVDDTAKAIVKEYYQSAAKRSYFVGCSNGGRQAMMEAQRYPDDFDGIVAGAPALNFTAIGAQFIKDSQASFPDAHKLTTPMLPPETLKFVEKKVLEACDTLDGVKDGVMEDPRRCKFDIASLPACTDDQPGAQCVTTSQRNVLNAIYGETKSKTLVIYPGQPFGGEGEGGGWQLWVAGVNAPLMALQNAPNARFAFGTEMFKYMVFDDPHWDYTRYDFSTWQKDTAQLATLTNAINPNLDAFKNKGHKVVLWHGWADGGLNALGTVDYYEQVEARDPKLRDYARLFMLPGVLHCAGGPGPDSVDWATVISDWVENNKAPERVIARKIVGGTVTNSRPLCPYPQHAVYKGNGSTDDAEHFACR